MGLPVGHTNLPTERLGDNEILKEDNRSINMRGNAVHKSRER